MNKELNIGMIGISDGNGHPYSWSAIFNGYDHKNMKDCKYPAIINYLKNKNFQRFRSKMQKLLIFGLRIKIFLIIFPLQL